MEEDKKWETQRKRKNSLAVTSQHPSTLSAIAIVILSLLALSCFPYPVVDLDCIKVGRSFLFSFTVRSPSITARVCFGNEINNCFDHTELLLLLVSQSRSLLSLRCLRRIAAAPLIPPLSKKKFSLSSLCISSWIFQRCTKHVRFARYERLAGFENERKQKLTSQTEKDKIVSGDESKQI